MSALLTHQGTQAAASDPTAPADRGWLRRASHRIRLTVQEMNYASRRVTELQAPWIVDQQWHSK
jgi:hypothetical protein